MWVAQTVKGTNPRSITWGHTLVRETAAGKNVKHISPDKRLKVSALIPVLPELQLIAAALSEIDAESTAIALRLVKTQAIQQGMMQEPLIGRTRSR